MNNKEFIKALDSIAKEKNISKDVIFDATTQERVNHIESSLKRIAENGNIVGMHRWDTLRNQVESKTKITIELNRTLLSKFLQF